MYIYMYICACDHKIKDKDKGTVFPVNIILVPLYLATLRTVIYMSPLPSDLAHYNIILGSSSANIQLSNP